MTTQTKTIVSRQERATRTDEEEGAVVMLPRLSGQRTSRRGFPMSRCGNPLGDISAAEDPLAACGGEGSVVRF